MIAIINIEKALRQAVSPIKLEFQSKALKPSLGRVTASAFYDDRNGEKIDRSRKKA